MIGKRVRDGETIQVNLTDLLPQYGNEGLNQAAQVGDGSLEHCAWDTGSIDNEVYISLLISSRFTRL